MVLQKIEAPKGISNTTFHRRCTGKQGYWWLRRDGSDFVSIGFHRGDEDLKIELDLDPGVYVLGCGPAGKFGHRERIEVV